MSTLHVTAETTTAQLEAILRKHGIERFDAGLYGRGQVSVRAVLRALAGPHGHAQVDTVARPTLIEAMNASIEAIEDLVHRSISVRAADGVLCGVYEPDIEGRRWAEKHLRALNGGMVRMPKSTLWHDKLA